MRSKQQRLRQVFLLTNVIAFGIDRFIRLKLQVLYHLVIAMTFIDFMIGKVEASAVPRITRRIMLAMSIHSKNYLVCAILLWTTCAAVSVSAQKTQTPPRTIFVYHTDEFWLNLHHFLYVLGRAQNKTTDSSREAVIKAPADQDKGLATLSEAERKVWNEAVAAYAAGLSKKDLVFDDPLPELTKALAQADESRSLAGTSVDPATAAILQRAEPIYRKVWWPAHKRANRAWRDSIQKLVRRHGPTVLSFITRAYGFSWPEAGYGVHISGYTNWAGAYSTKGDLLVLSSLSEGEQGLYGLETIFHEGMHQWDSQMFDAIRTQARLHNKFAPRGLSHALIFFTAGEAIRHVAPEHVPYAEKFGVWERGLTQFKQPLEQTWKPYLNGKGTRDEALAELINLIGESKP